MHANFSEGEVTDNTFVAEVLDFSIAPTMIIDVDNPKPSETMIRNYELRNDGALSILTVTLGTSYTSLTFMEIMFLLIV